jgi:putative ABC transport system permease protein
VPGVVEPATGRLVSVPDRGRPGLNGLTIREGRYVSAGHPDEVLLNETFAEANKLAPGDHLTAIVNGHKRELKVVGIALSPEYIYSLGPGSLVPDNRRFGVIWMSRDALEAAFDLEGAFNDVSVTLLHGASAPAVIDAMDRLLAPYGGIGAYDRDEQTSHAFLDGEFEQLHNIGRIIPPIFLAVAAFLLHVLTSRLVDTEREQIGLLKAFGYGSVEIAWHYLKMVLAMVAVGLIAGSIAGIWFGHLMTQLYMEFYRFPFLYFQLEPSVFVTVVLIGGAAGGAGALSAALRAARLPPAVAMQPAPPVSYRRGVFDRLRMARALSQPGRMILRHIVRWPFRAAITSLGIAMSVALMVSTLFFFDATDYMIETFYNMSHRPDLTISFVEAAAPKVVEEARRLPGIVTAEPGRAVAVRLRHGALSERTAIQGIAPDADLVRVLDTGLRQLKPAPFGLMLSDKLAEMLAVGRGDVVTVEVLEGRRPVVEVPVTALVQEYIGTPAYMDLTALNRLMGEGPRVSAVDMLIDPSQANELYAELKELPAVAGVTLWSVAIQSFRDTMAESMNIIILFYVGFGAAIAIAVAYNSARISLSERGRELASLRVLGLTRFEVSYILLGELLVLTLAALPIGCVIGYWLARLMTWSFETELYRIPLVIEPATYGLACAAVLAATAVSGLLVRRRIDTLDLIAVLKTRE